MRQRQEQGSNEQACKKMCIDKRASDLLFKLSLKLENDIARIQSTLDMPKPHLQTNELALRKGFDKAEESGNFCSFAHCVKQGKKQNLSIY